jgi:hypothetical protein
MPAVPALGLIAALAAGPTRGGDVVSPAPAGVTVTVYRDGPPPNAIFARSPGFADQGLGFITETRTVELPAGRARVRFEGVAEGIIPQSAGVEGLPGRLVERNFDFDLLSAGSLVAHAVGQQVSVVRTNRRTGRETRDRARIRSGPNGVVLDFGDHVEALHCDGEPERLVFDHVPPDLAARPTLSVLTDTPRAGRYKVRLSYLAVRLNWTADYIARVAPDGASLDLTGWITLTNGEGTGFADAPTAVVAGDVARIPANRPRPVPQRVRPACWPGQTTHSGWIDAPVVTVTAMRRAFPDEVRGFALMDRKPMAAPAPPPPPPPVVERRLGDYHLYVLTNPTTVAARQTKQVMFLHEAAVRADTVYAATLDGIDAARTSPARTVLRLDNTAEHGLGRGLPGGTVQVRQRQARGDGRELLVGEARLERDVPVGEPFELVIGNDRDVTIHSDVVTRPPLRYPFHGRYIQTVTVQATNAKATPVTVEIRHSRRFPKGFEVTTESQSHGLKSGDPLWRFVVPAGETHALTYSVAFMPG